MDKLLVFIGAVFCICAAIFDWNFFFNNYKAAPFVKLFGRDGARKIYVGFDIFLLFAAFIL